MTKVNKFRPSGNTSYQKLADLVTADTPDKKRFLLFFCQFSPLQAYQALNYAVKFFPSDHQGQSLREFLLVASEIRDTMLVIHAKCAGWELPSQREVPDLIGNLNDQVNAFHMATMLERLLFELLANEISFTSEELKLIVELKNLYFSIHADEMGWDVPSIAS